MAATDFPNLRSRAIAAVAALLGTGSSSAAADRWTWDASYTHYSESERITVSEPQIGLRRDLDGERTLSVLATVDTISGATPLGTLPATANTVTNTLTSPSGRAINPDIGRVPTSDMSDTRLSLSTTYERPVGAASRHRMVGTVSKERDFLSLGTSFTVNRDFNQKNTTLSFGLSPEFDIVSPKGGLPLSYAREKTAGEFNGSRDMKYIVGGLLGITQVINKRTLMQWNYSPTYENGYLNDPYKLISLTNTGGDPLYAVHEQRPGSRLQHSFYWLTRYAMRERDVFGLGLRYLADNWGVRSQTIDFTYRWQSTDKRFWEPHVRYYHQTAADFFRAGIVDTQGLPDYASADYRLNDIDGVTFGLRFGYTLQNGSSLIFRAEYYTQTGEQRPRSVVGAQRAFNLFPTLHASILQIQYTFEPAKLWKRT